MAVYWARVLRLAFKAKRRTGQAANLLPPEPLGRLLRLVWFPTVGLWIALPLLAGFATSDKRLQNLSAAFVPLYRSAAISWSCLAVAIAAFAATWVCWQKMGRSWRMGINPDDRTRLVVTGAYAFLRHPIYALSSLLMLCTMAILPSPLMLVVGVTHLALLQWEARREEAHLLVLHGHAYAAYRARVGRFLPRIS